MKKLLYLLLLVCSSNIFGQIGYDIKPLKLDRNGRLVSAPKGFTPIKLSAAETKEINQYLLENSVNFDTSLTIVNDTVGCHLNGEYLWFPQLSIYISQDYYKRFDWNQDSTQYVSPWVSNADYDVFKHYVRDSLMRRKLMDEDSDPELWSRCEYEYGEECYINYNPTYHYTIAPTGSDDPNQSKYGKRDIFADFFYPSHESLNGFQIDPRRLVYQFYWVDVASANKYKKENPNKKGQNGAIRGHTDLSKFIISEVVPVLRDTGFWFRTNLPENYKEWLTENYTTSDLFQDMPVLGLTGYQAWAFCKWKEQVYGIISAPKKDPFFVPNFTIELPRKIQAEKALQYLPKLTLPEVNNEWWRITNEDYLAFVLAVQDSIVQKGMIEHFYPDDVLLETYDVNGKIKDDADWHLNHYLSRKELYEDKQADYWKDFHEKFSQPDSSCWTCADMIHPLKMYYQYDWIDYRKANVIGDFEVGKPRMYKHSPDWLKDIEIYNLSSVDEHGSLLGKDLNFYTFNKLGNDPGVRSHKSREVFFVQEIINIYPYIPGKDTLQVYDFWSCPDCIVQGVSWGQAKAYYHWYINKRRGHQKMTKNNPTAKMKPTKPQWQRIMNGEKIILPQKEIELPVPAFRYVIN